MPLVNYCLGGGLTYTKVSTSVQKRFQETKHALAAGQCASGLNFGVEIRIAEFKVTGYPFLP